MLKNFTVVAFRNLVRNRVFAGINIIGLSIGMACSMLILLWVADELSFNQFHAHYGHIYKVLVNQEYSGKVSTIPAAPYPLELALVQASAGVKRAAMTNYGEGAVLSAGENRITMMGLAVTEDFLRIFSFRMIEGDPMTALKRQPGVILTESVARTLFGKEKAIVKLVRYDNRADLQVTGVVADVPRQSTISFDFLLPMSFYASLNPWVTEFENNWKNHSFHIYVELESTADLAGVERATKYLVRDHEESAKTAELLFHPMSRWRLYDHFENGAASGGLIDYVRMFSAVAVLIIVMACINFMNLATARSERRAREVGIRKSAGSRRHQLVTQFLGESIFITAVAFVVAIAMVELVLPAYNVMVNKHLTVDYASPTLWLITVGLILFTGVLAGSYPAFYLSGFQPSRVLKGKVETSRGATMPRRILVTLQFGFSIFMIMGTAVAYQQVQHVKAREMGYDRENLMLVWSNVELEKNFPAIKEELLNTGAVKAVCKSSAPITRIFSSSDVEWQGKDPGVKVGFVTLATEFDFAKTMDIRVLEGRDFAVGFSDSSNVVINRTAMDVMGLKNPIGATIRMWGDAWTVIGVTEDVVMGSPYAAVDPTVTVFMPDWTSTISIRLDKTTDLPGAISKVEAVFKKLNPSFPISWRFADVEFDTKFSNINLISRLASTFAALAILITCLGLFGLAAFTAEQRRKELGIRKVLGATVSGLILLLSRDFSRLIVVAFLLASPLAWWFLNDVFLGQYQYRISPAWWIIPAAGLFSLILAMIVVGAQAFRVATSNSIDSLREE